MILYGMRASAILYALLRGHAHHGPYLLPANVCPIVPTTFLKAGRAFELVDIDEQTLCMDQQAALRLLGDQSRSCAGVLFVRTYGTTVDPSPFFRAAKAANPDALLIDDKCLCRPEIRSDKASLADVELFSTGYSKYIDIGWGGFAYAAGDVRVSWTAEPYDEAALARLTTETKAALAARCPFVYCENDWLDMRPPAMPRDDYFAEISAALPKMDEHKRNLNHIYRHHLPDGLVSADDAQAWRYNVLVPNKDEVLRAIFEAGLFASSHYASLGGIFAPGRFPNAEALHAKVVNLFNDARFTATQARALCAAVSGIRKSGQAMT